MPQLLKNIAQKKVHEKSYLRINGIVINTKNERKTTSIELRKVHGKSLCRLEVKLHSYLL